MAAGPLARAVVLLVLGAAGNVAADLPLTYDCPRTSAPIRIDGKLDDAAWQKAPWTADFVDIEGDKKPKPRFRTRAKMLWDDQYFYIAAELEEPHVWATLTEHDSVIFRDNDFEVFIDPNGDTLEYYEFEINALNTGWDLFLDKPYRQGGKARNDWEIPGLRTAVHIAGTLNDPGDVDKGWTVEIAFPWKALGEYAHKPAPPHPGDEWRVNFSRVEWLHEIVEGKYSKVKGRKEDNWVWSPQGVINMHIPEHWGRVRFVAYHDIFSEAGQQTIRAEVRAKCSAPDTAILDRRWVDFIRGLPAEADGKQAYIGFLKDRYQYTIARVNEAYGIDYSSFTDLTAFDFLSIERDRPVVVKDDEAFIQTMRDIAVRISGEELTKCKPNR